MTLDKTILQYKKLLQLQYVLQALLIKNIHAWQKRPPMSHVMKVSWTDRSNVHKITKLYGMGRQSQCYAEHLT